LEYTKILIHIVFLHSHFYLYTYIKHNIFHQEYLTTPVVMVKSFGASYLFYDWLCVLYKFVSD